MNSLSVFLYPKDGDQYTKFNKGKIILFRYEYRNEVFLITFIQTTSFYINRVFMQLF